MFHSRKQNHHINRIHERALRVVYKDHNSSFDELLEKDNSCKIHDRNLQKLVTEIFKVKMNLAPEIMKEVFEIKVFRIYALRNELKLKSRKIYSVRYGIETASFVGARAWNSLPSDLKECESLELFESKINSKVLDLQLGLLLSYTFYMYICIYVSLCTPLGTGGRLSVHKTFRRHSMTTCGRLVCFQHTSCVLSVRFFSYFYLFLLKADLD